MVNFFGCLLLIEFNFSGLCSTDMNAIDDYTETNIMWSCNVMSKGGYVDYFRNYNSMLSDVVRTIIVRSYQIIDLKIFLSV